MIRPILLLSPLSQAPTTRDWLWTGRLALGNLWALLVALSVSATV